MAEGRKRSLVSPTTQDATTDTEELCRAVKRLQTFTPLVGAGSIASLQVENGAACKFQPSDRSSFRANSANESSGDPSVQDSFGSALQYAEEDCVDRSAQLHGHSKLTKRPTAISQVLHSQNMGTEEIHSKLNQAYPIEETGNSSLFDKLPASSSNSAKQESHQAVADSSPAQPSRDGTQIDMSNIQRRLQDMAVDDSVEEDTDKDFVEQPGTPVRSEASSPKSGRGQTSGSHKDPIKSKQDEYALLYEEANMMLKNLHFERLQRVAQN